MTVKSLEELLEMALGVMGARRGLRMVLNGKDRFVLVLDPFYGAIIEVTMRHLKLISTRNDTALPPNREPVVL